MVLYASVVGRSCANLTTSKPTGARIQITIETVHLSRATGPAGRCTSRSVGLLMVADASRASSSKAGAVRVEATNRLSEGFASLIHDGRQQNAP